tara:strand:- start:520 stop:1674 length:1155 start_codon:yes stop_codon:yes gene_type:complete
MKLNEFGDYANQLKRINRYLQENFGYTINMESIDSDRVNSTLKKVLARQAQIANETNVKDYHKIPEYNKTVMVAEALKILLREIAPKRQAKEKDTNVQESKMTQQVKEDAGIRGEEKKKQRASGSVSNLSGERKRKPNKKPQAKTKRQAKVSPHTSQAVPGQGTPTIVKYGPKSDAGNKGPTLTAGKYSNDINPRSITLENLRTLLEQDLDQAELVLAAKDMVDRIQKMAENLAEMQVEELMPLVDAMKEHFGPDVAQVFNSSVEATLQQALDTIKATRDGVDNAVLALTGEAPVQSDMGAMPAPEMGMDADPSMEVPSEEDFGGDEAMAGDTPAIGREMKPESVSTFALTQAKKILMQGAKNGKVSKQAVKEAALVLAQKKNS